MTPSTTTQIADSNARSRLNLSSRITAAAIALTLGLTIVFGVGFVQGTNDVIHNAAHDTRHTLVFPCH